MLRVYNRLMDANNTQIKLVFAIVGKDRFLRADALDRIKAMIGDRADMMGSVRFEGKDAELADVLDEVRMPSLTGDMRIAIVDDAGSFITAHREALENYCKRPADCGYLILMCDSLASNTKLYKLIATSGEIIKVDPPKGNQIGVWIQKRAQEVHGKKIGGAAANNLARHIGDSCGQLDMELGKLTAYIGERAEISSKDVGTMTGQLREEKVFGVIDAINLGDTDGALHLWEQVLATDRAAPGRAIGGLAWAVREFISGRRRGGRASRSELEAQQRDLLEADLATKTSATTVASAIEKFIVKHSANKRVKRSA